VCSRSILSLVVRKSPLAAYEDLISASARAPSRRDCTCGRKASAPNIRTPKCHMRALNVAVERRIELIRRIRALPDGRGEIPAMALTAYARAEDRRKAIVAGYQMHLAKPVEPRELVCAVAELVRIGRG
jgi:CheY-like chemotaxis protein